MTRSTSRTMACRRCGSSMRAERRDVPGAEAVELPPSPFHHAPSRSCGSRGQSQHAHEVRSLLEPEFPEPAAASVVDGASVRWFTRGSRVTRGPSRTSRYPCCAAEASRSALAAAITLSASSRGTSS
jgi:hypothetical protein